MIGRGGVAIAPLVAAALVGCAPIPQSADGAQSRMPASFPARAEPARIVLDGQAVQGGALLGMAPSGTRRLTLDGTTVVVASDGRFLIAFDRDAAATAELTAMLADGREVRQTVTVAPRGWRIERLDTLPRVSQPSAEFARRRPDELARIVAARATSADVGGWRQRFIWPVSGRISGLFGAQRVYKGEPGSYHSGVDVAVPGGTPIVAPADGIVTLATAAPFTLEGNLLMLDHGAGLNSAFLHLSRIDVRPGAFVRQGQVIGAVGSTGRATGPHMHWGMMWRASRIDPLLLAGAMPTG